MAWTIKEHDTWPPLVLTLADQNGPIDLTTATAIRLLLRSNQYLVTGSMLKTDALAGLVTYNWAVGDTQYPGRYRGEVEITWSSGAVETVPNDSYFDLTILEDLDP